MRLAFFAAEVLHWIRSRANPRWLARVHQWLLEISWEARDTDHLLKSPANAKRLRKGIVGLNAGRGVERKLIEPDKH